MDCVQLQGTESSVNQQLSIQETHILPNGVIAARFLLMGCVKIHLFISIFSKRHYLHIECKDIKKNHTKHRKI